MAGHIQITLIKIYDYKNWTAKMGNDREYRLQMLQASLYKDLQEYFSKVGGLVFNTSHDELIALSNGIGYYDHVNILKKINESYPFRITMSLARESSPYRAQQLATKGLYEISDKNPVRMFNVNGYTHDDKIGIMHIDVNNFTTNIRPTMSSYEASANIYRLYVILLEKLLKMEMLVFYCGGDNFMATYTYNEIDYIEDVIEKVSEESKMAIKAGMGEARKPRKAAELATEALEMIRAGKVKGSIHSISEF